MEISEFLAHAKKILAAKKIFYFYAKIISGAPKTEIREIFSAEKIKIRVAAAPVRGRANAEIRRFLQKIFAAKIEIISGKKNPEKLIKIFLD